VPYQRRDARLSNPPKAEAGKRDAELRDRKVTIQTERDSLGYDRLSLSLSSPRAKLGRPYLDEGKLRCNEESVQGDAERSNDQAPHGVPVLSREEGLAAVHERS
jgi:hypothetical protein